MSSPLTFQRSGTRRDRKRQSLAEHVARVAFALFETSGFEAVGMEQIAAAADIAKATLYKYFPTKDALLAFHFEQQVLEATGPLWRVLESKPGFAAQMKHLLQVSARWHAARRAFVAPYVRHQFSEPGASRQMFTRLCAAGQQRGDVRSDLSAEQLGAQLDALSLGALMNWLRVPDSSLRAEFDAVLLLALKGVGAPGRAPHNATGAA